MKSISGWNILLYYNTDKYRQLLHRGEFIISLFHANVFPIQSMCIYLADECGSMKLPVLLNKFLYSWTCLLSWLALKSYSLNYCFMLYLIILISAAVSYQQKQSKSYQVSHISHMSPQPIFSKVNAHGKSILGSAPSVLTWHI